MLPGVSDIRMYTQLIDNVKLMVRLKWNMADFSYFWSAFCFCFDDPIGSRAARSTAKCGRRPVTHWQRSAQNICSREEHAIDPSSFQSTRNPVVALVAFARFQGTWQRHRRIRACRRHRCSWRMVLLTLIPRVQVSSQDQWIPNQNRFGSREWECIC